LNKERELLIKLTEEKARIEKEIKSLTYAKSGMSYGKLIRLLLQNYVADNNKGLTSVQKHRIYSDLHHQVSSRIGIKTQVFTKSEYIQAIEIIKNVLNIPVDMYYIQYTI